MPIQAKAAAALHAVLNFKLETASLDNIYQPQQGGVVGTVEVLAYGTAGVLS